MPNVHFIGISKAQTKNLPFPFYDVVYNGVDTGFFVPDGIEGERKFLIAGRIVVEEALAAQQSSVPYLTPLSLPASLSLIKLLPTIFIKEVHHSSED
jgi:hypothetical protein